MKGSRSADVVIGCSYGDEGKGRVTEALAQKFTNKSEDVLVVRYNGGAQAGHTVIHEGKRHVFHHIGSGSFVGADTFLSENFVVNPVVFKGEHIALLERKCKANVIVDNTSMYTTPWDMIVNTELEKSRGSNRHGSCGMGFNETKVRCMGFPLFDTTVGGMTDSTLEELLEEIQMAWFPRRLIEYGLNITAVEGIDSILSKEFRKKFISDIKYFLDHVRIEKSPWTLQKKYDNIIFEGAQGLLLDEEMGTFPHVTHSNTGLKGAALVARTMDIGKFNLHYVTRPYLTRHGAGPLPLELETKPYDDGRIVDETNVPNDWQGSLRFAHLSLTTLHRSIVNDGINAGATLASGNIDTKFDTLHITCMDQMYGKRMFYYLRDTKRFVPSEEFILDVEDEVVFPINKKGKVHLYFSPANIPLFFPGG